MNCDIIGRFEREYMVICFWTIIYVKKTETIKKMRYKESKRMI